MIKTMLIKDLYENDLGNMEGMFYSDLFGYDIQVIFGKDIPKEYVERNINYLNTLKIEFLIPICKRIKNYFEDYNQKYPDLSEDIDEDILGEFHENPISILKHIDIGVYKIYKYAESDKNIPAINLRGDCEWAGDEGITIALKGNEILYVGPWVDINIWTSKYKELSDNYA